jgi:hypothetical protein
MLVNPLQQFAPQSDGPVFHVAVVCFFTHTILTVFAPLQTVHVSIAKYRPPAVVADTTNFVGPDLHLLPAGRTVEHLRLGLP